MPSTTEPRRGPLTGRARSVSAIVVGLVAAALAVVTPTASAAPTTPAATDWLGIVNVYRAQSGLTPIAENPAWSSGSRNHSCWMLLNGIAHDETPGSPGYTPDGDEAGNSGNVAVSSSSEATPRGHIDLWMSGPFHAIGILRPSLTHAAYGMCASPPNPSTTRWNSAATLDVVRGNNWGAPKPAAPIVFPGNGSTTSLTRFVAESPDPRSFCNWGAQNVGLPLIAMMPSAVSAATATLNGPGGAVPTCVLTRSNTSGTASAILGGDNAVVVVPATPLTAGTYTANVTSDGGTVTWSFNVDSTAPLTAVMPSPQALETTTAIGDRLPFQPITPFRLADSRSHVGLERLAPNQQVRVRIAGRSGLPADMSAISANFTAVSSPAAGYLTASNCAEVNPSFSTLNYEANDAVPNQAIIPLDQGDICLFSSQWTDVIIDVNGYVAPESTQVLVPVTPKRLYDSRGSQPLRPGQVLRVDVEGGASPAPDAAVAVAVNITGVSPDRSGWVRAFPCDVAEPGVSSLNPRVGRARANSALVPTGADGTICLTSDITTDVIIDITGWFGDRDGRQFLPIRPIRLADTRQNHPVLNGGAGPTVLVPGRALRVEIAGTRGISSSARAATLNVVATGGSQGGYLTVAPCGQPTDVSTLNFPESGATANGATVMLDSSGAVCVTTSSPTHVIVDITGTWE